MTLQERAPGIGENETGRATRKRAPGQARRAAQTAVTVTGTEATTSGCSSTVTVCNPVDLMFPGKRIRLRSSSGPPASLTAVATSADVIEPNSRPTLATRRLTPRSRCDLDRDHDSYGHRESDRDDDRSLAEGAHLEPPGALATKLSVRSAFILIALRVVGPGALRLGISRSRTRIGLRFPREVLSGPSDDFATVFRTADPRTG